MDAYYLSPDAKDRQGFSHDRGNSYPERFDDGWLAPWLMGGPNGQVVRRSRSLKPETYGPLFRRAAWGRATPAGKVKEFACAWWHAFFSLSLCRAPWRPAMCCMRAHAVPC